MDSSSDEDFLPDPERYQGGFDLPLERKRKPPDKKRKLDESDNKQRGLNLHDDFSKGKCFFIFCVSVLNLLNVNRKMNLFLPHQMAINNQ